MRSKSWSWIFIGFLFAAMRLVGVAQVTTTPVADIIYHADGTTATGTALISWPAFTSSRGDQVPAGSISVLIGAGGSLSVNLVPNSGGIPIGTYYTVTYHLDDNSVTRQYWVVPQSTTPVRISAIESTVLPISVAMQTVTRSYVDTAIANAAGHPVDTSGFVQKTGDTMTGPLQLPADPATPLQAATKNYVDTTVAAQVTGSSSLSGQTTNALPRATSATASTTSSRFYDVPGGLAGADASFRIQAWTPNCQADALSFDSVGCVGFNLWDDGTGPGAVDGLTMTFNAYGGGGVADNAEGRVDKLFGDSRDAALATYGIKQLWSSNTACYGGGDCDWIRHYHAMDAGVMYPSDEGSTGTVWMGQQQPIGTSPGYWSATITSGGTNQHPNVATIKTCTNQYNDSCTAYAGAWAIDVTTPAATGKLTGTHTDFTTGGINWIGSLPTDQTTIPVATAWGYATNINLTAQGTWETPHAQTFALQGGSGTFAANDLVCMIGTNYTEQQVITSVSGSSPTQTIRLPLAKQETSVAIFKGGCQYLSFDADWNHFKVRYTYPAVSLDGTNLLYVVPAYGTNWDGGAFPYPGTMWAQTDGGTDAGFATYYGARVTKVGTISPGLLPLIWENSTAFFEPNTFAVGDVIESPDFPTQHVTGLSLTFAQKNAPADPGSNLNGMFLHMVGSAAAGSSTVLTLDNQHFHDASGDYTGYGGRLTPPHMIATKGIFSDVLSGEYTPSTSVLTFGSHQAGQSSYNIFQDPSWGQISIHDDHSIRIDGSSFYVSGDQYNSFHTETGVGFFVHDSGVNNVGVGFKLANSANGLNWLAPCDQNGGSSNKDMCLGSNGASRDGYLLTPDRGLRVGTLSVGSTSAPCAALTAGTSALCPTTSPVLFSSNTGQFMVEADGQGTDAKLWDAGVYSANTLSFRFINDANSAANDWLDVVRSGYAPQLATFHEPVSAPVYQGPSTAPTGSCSTVGWAFSQDGHISFCDGSAWASKM